MFNETQIPPDPPLSGLTGSPRLDKWTIVTAGSEKEGVPKIVSNEPHEISIRTEHIK